jgi:hypothetical protein
MELLDRYLQAVRKHLPWERQDDIIAELRANLEAQLEDKEAELGRPLTAGEAEEWLKQIGPPRQVAAHYQPQRYLIGPTLFPTYWLVLKTVLFCLTIIFVIVSALQFAVEVPSGIALLQAVLRVPVVLIEATVWVTVIFAAMEFAAARSLKKRQSPAGYPVDWSPSTLPPVEEETASGKKPRGRAHAVAEVILIFLCLAWLLLLPQHPYLLIGPGAAYLHARGEYVSPFHLAPVWLQAYWWVVALTLLQLVWCCVDLIRGSRQQPRHALRVAMSALGLIPLGLLLSIGDHAYITLNDPALDQARYGAALHGINKGIFRGASILCAIAVLQLLWEAGRMGLNVYRKRAAAMR